MSLYIISDLHFDDPWICDDLRPYGEVDKMNASLLANCRAKIDDGDTLVFLADLVGSESSKADVLDWYGKLPEIDCWVPGDHDHIPRSEYEKTPLPVRAPFFKEIAGRSFRIKHKPYRREGGDHWIIHGHKHNEKPDEYPFINPSERRINVSASMIGYEPIALTRVLELIETGERYQCVTEIE